MPLTWARPTVVFGTVLVALGAVATLAAQTQAAATLTLQGTVVRAGTGSPIGGADVVAARVGGTLADYRVATTDPGGRFAFGDLSAGSYRVYATHDNYLQAEYGRRLVGATGLPIALVDGQTAAPITVEMTPPGAIAGRVFDDGRPAPGIWLRALKPYFFDGERSFRIAAWARTDDRGDFRLFGLTPGLYYVSAMPFANPRLAGDNQETPIVPTIANGNQRTRVAPVTPEILDPAALDPFIYPAVFYPGTTDLSMALPIDVEAGETYAGVTLSVARVLPRHVRGRVSVVEGYDGEIRVSAVRQMEAVNLAIPSVDAREGTFDLAGVPPGRYVLVAQTRNEATRWTGVRTVEVIDSDLTDVAIQIQPTVTVTGVVTIDGRPPGSEGGPILVQLLNSAGLPGVGAKRAEPDGTVVLEGIAPGDYRFRVIQSRMETWIRSARFGADDVTEAVVRVDGEPTGRRLEIDLSTAVATLDVTVTDATQRPAAGVLVVAVPDAARRTRSAYFRTGTTDAFGRVRIRGVAPGEYRVFATTDIEANAWEDPDVIKANEARGELVRLAENGTGSVALRIVK